MILINQAMLGLLVIVAVHAFVAVLCLQNGMV